MRDVHADIESFAELAGALDEPFADRAALLGAAALDERSLAELRARWQVEIRRSAELLAPRYAAAYARAAGAARAVRRGAAERPGVDPRFLNAEAQPWREEAAAVPLQATAAQVAPAPASVRASVVSPPPLDEPEGSATVPFSALGIEAAPRYLRAPTVPVDAASGEALPFRPAEQPPAQALESAVKHAEAVQGPPSRAASGGTVDVGALAAPTLPFDRPGPTIALPAEPAPRPGALRAATVALDGPAPAAASLPFRADKAAPAQALESAVAHAHAVQGPASAPNRAASGGTIDVGVAAGPGAPAQAVAVPEFTLEQYASLCVEIALGPDRVALTLTRYRLDAASRAALDAHWRARFGTVPGLRAAFAQAFSAYKAALTDPARQRR